MTSTEAQREIWAAAQLGREGSCAFNQALTVTLRGPLDVADLRSALDDVVERHDALRVTLTSNGERLCFAAALHLEVPVVDLSLQRESDRAVACEQAINDEVTRPFDLECGPLVRARLVRLHDDEHVLLLTVHHIVCDGWSVEVLLRSLADCYSARRRRSGAGVEPAPAFYEFAAAKERERGGAVYAAAQQYWHSQFRESIPVLDLPTSNPRAPIRTFHAGREDRLLPFSLVASTRRVGASAGCSLFATLLAAWEVYLCRVSGQQDVVVGIPIAEQAILGLDSLVGHCVSLLPVRSQLSPDDRFVDRLRATRAAVADAMEYRACTFGSLIRTLRIQRDASRIPLVPVVLNIDRSRTKLPFEGLETEYRWTARRFETFELHLNAVETEQGIALECTYNADLFDASLIRHRLQEFETLLGGLVANPGEAISKISVVAETVRQGSQAPYPRDATLAELFEEQVARTPDAPAVTCEGSSLTYRELNARANQLAHLLRRRGVGPDVPVGLSVERSLEMIVGVLGIVKAGGAYVPLDPDYPAQRLAFMLADIQTPVVVTQAKWAERWSAGASTVLLDADGSSLAAESPDNPAANSRAEHLAYVMYTSGSTGRPKGVCIEQRSVVRLVMNTDYVELGPKEVFLQLAPMAFDAATFELWGSLLHGAKLIVAPPVTGSLTELLDLIERERVSVLWLTATVFHQIVDQHWPRLRHVRQILAGGEPLSVPHVKKALAALSTGQRLINGYGPTENTTFTCCHVMTAGSRISTTVPIGRPIAHTHVYVLDARGQAVGVGVAGELYIGGDGLAREYWRAPGITAERFVRDPARGRLYRSGDLVRYMPNGTLEFLGRLDRQVKIRGYRIELGEIESALTHHPGVKQAYVSVRESPERDRRLVAYTACRADARPSAAELWDHLRTMLPGYMLPQHIILLDALPLSPAGKVDSAALPAPWEDTAAATAPDDTFAAPSTAMEALIAGVWGDAIGMAAERVGRYDNFFDLGGHSLLAMAVIETIERKTGHRLSLIDLARATLTQLAGACEKRNGKQERRSTSLLQRAVRAMSQRWVRPTE